MADGVWMWFWIYIFHNSSMPIPFRTSILSNSSIKINLGISTLYNSYMEVLLRQEYWLLMQLLQSCQSLNVAWFDWVAARMAVQLNGLTSDCQDGCPTDWFDWVAARMAVHLLGLIEWLSSWLVDWSYWNPILGTVYYHISQAWFENTF